MNVDQKDEVDAGEGLLAAQLFKAGGGAAQSGPHRRSPSTSSLPVDAADWCRPTKVVGNESAASLIGSDSALLVRDKPPLPRGRLGSLGRRKTKKSLGMDADEQQLSRTGSSKKKGSVFRDALNFFKSR